MSKYSPPDDDDLIFFREAMKDVKRIRRLADTKLVMKKEACYQISKVHVDGPYKVDKDLLLDLSDPLEQSVTAKDKLFFRREGPQVKLIKKLIRGEIARSSCLDLHGMSVEQARVAVINFLQASQKAGFRCVQIIHGKGRITPKLKNYVNYWLPQFRGVLAFSSAQARDGGSGAVYILLAKKGF